MFCFCSSFIGYYGAYFFKENLVKILLLILVHFGLMSPDSDYVVSVPYLCRFLFDWVFIIHFYSTNIGNENYLKNHFTDSFQSRWNP